MNITNRTLQDITRGLSAISKQREAEDQPGIPQEEINSILEPASVPPEVQA